MESGSGKDETADSGKPPITGGGGSAIPIIEDMLPSASPAIGAGTMGGGGKTIFINTFVDSITAGSGGVGSSETGMSCSALTSLTGSAGVANVEEAVEACGMLGELTNVSSISSGSS
eukprot:Lithocolla_globosa_v1_NODE_7782_length_901_cov_3.221040.p2 type:complete len:117 gc:universal NODE_7782_length_901_cov_3.221040:821-471(-)